MAATEAMSAAMADLLQGVHQEGKVLKQGAFMPEFKTRYFVLKDNTVSYYKAKLEYDAMQPPLGSIPCKLRFHPDNCS